MPPIPTRASAIAMLLAMSAPLAVAAQEADAPRAGVDTPNAAPEAIGGKCKPNRSGYTVEAGLVITTSTVPVDIPGFKRSFKVGGNKPSCVIVTFTAELIGESEDNISIRAIIPGIGTGQPPNYFTGRRTETGVATRTLQFVYPSVPPGKHKVKIQYNGIDGDQISVRHRVLRVDYTE